MYLDHFGLRERPFSNAPDLRFVYLGRHHEQAIAHLLQCMEVPGSVVLLTGESGIGKTTTCRMLLSRLPKRVDVALILNPALTPNELLAFVCEELGVSCGIDATSQTLIGDALYRKLVDRLGTRRTVLIVDEAHNLRFDVVDQLQLLSTLEVDGRRLIEFILIGEPALIDLLGRAPMHPPTGATTGYYLLPFAEEDTGAYVHHRLEVAGGRDVFDADALREVHRLSSGVPGHINTICDRALSIAAAQGYRNVDGATVRVAARAAPAPFAPPQAVEPRRDSRRATPAAASRPEEKQARRNKKEPRGARQAEVLPARPTETGRPRPAETPRARPTDVSLADKSATAPQPIARAAPRRRRRRWPWLVGGGLVVNAVVMAAVFLGPRLPDVVAPASETTSSDMRATEAPPSDTTEPNPREPDAQPTRSLAEAESFVRGNQPAQTAQPTPPVPPVSPPAAPAGPAPRMASMSPEPTTSAEESARQRQRGARAEPHVAGAAIPPSTPAANQQPLPAHRGQLKIDMLVWAVEPRQRMVYVNGQKYIEGEKLANGAILQQIEPNGIILLQEGQRLRLRSESR
jgi:type II secretory pathway predicted ATPase ExeA